MREAAFVALCLSLAAALLLFGVGAWELAIRAARRIMGWLDRVEARRRDF